MIAIALGGLLNGCKSGDMEAAQTTSEPEKERETDTGVIFQSADCGKYVLDYDLLPPVETEAVIELVETVEAMGQAEQTEPETSAYLPGDAGIENQICILADTISVWLPAWTFFYENESLKDVSLAVTDLDENGRLELFMSGIMGSGSCSYHFLWEVKETFDGIELCYGWGDSGAREEADIIWQTQPICAYRESEGERLSYIFDDVSRDGLVEFYGGRQAISFHDGELSIVELALFWETLNEEGEDFISVYVDAQGNEISKKDYEAVVDEWFEGYGRYQVYIGWTEGWPDWGRISAEERVSLLQESWEGFLIVQP